MWKKQRLKALSEDARAQESTSTTLEMTDEVEAAGHESGNGMG